MQNKIVRVRELITLLNEHHRDQTIGVVTGCFDILHTGHIDLFIFAKQHVDVLIVGIDTDLAIKKTKGELRPINRQSHRAKMLAAIEYVDYVLLLSCKYEFSTQQANKYYDNLITKLKPNHLITGKSADFSLKVKKERIERVGGTLLINNRKRPNSTSRLAAKIAELD